MSIESSCSLRSPDRERVKIWRSCPIEGRRAPGIVFYRHSGPSGPGSRFAFGMLRRASKTRRGFDGDSGNVKNSQRNAYGALPAGPIYRHRVPIFYIRRESNCPRSLPSLRV